MVEYKDRLLRALEDSRKSTQELADAIGISYQAVKKALTGATKELSASNNAKAAKFLLVNSDWLALGEGEKARSKRDFATAARFVLDTYTNDIHRQVAAQLIMDTENRLAAMARADEAASRGNVAVDHAAG